MTTQLMPQDDIGDFDPDTCDCEFTPYGLDDADDGEESWHYLRRCAKCNATWYSLHCRCERPFILCASCR